MIMVYQCSGWLGDFSLKYLQMDTKMYIVTGCILAFIIIVGSCALQLLTTQPDNAIQRMAQEDF